MGGYSGGLVGSGRERGRGGKIGREGGGSGQRKEDNGLVDELELSLVQRISTR